MSTTTETIKERVSIVDIVGTYVKLERAGSNMKAKCPFHNEKTPSFMVSPDRNTYYCFGCGEKGDIFSFVERFEGTDFKGALKILAERAGVPLLNERPEEQSEIDHLREVMERATLFFEGHFKNNEKAREYLKKRGLSDATMRQFRIGYAPAAWRELRDFLAQAGISDTLMERDGFIKRTSRSAYDRFRGRIMFPIMDSAGRVIAFSGRHFEDMPARGEDEEREVEPAKYINSPETPLYSKSATLFAYDKAKLSIRQSDFTLVVEGQMDALLSHQSGFRNTVALSGTALTLEHITRMRRLSNNVVFALDADAAGIAAAQKSARIALEAGMDVKVAALPQGEDPADIILRDYVAWKGIIRDARHVIEFILDSVAREGYDERKTRLRSSGMVMPFLSLMPNKIDQAHFVSLVANRLMVPERAVWEEVARAKTEKKPGFFSTQNTPGNKNNNLSGRETGSDPLSATSMSPRVSALVSILAWQRAVETPRIDPDALEERLVKIIGHADATVAFEKREHDLPRLIFTAEETYGASRDLERDIHEIFTYIEREQLQAALQAAERKLRAAEANGNHEEAKKLIDQCQTISREIGQLR